MAAHDVKRRLGDVCYFASHRCCAATSGAELSRGAGYASPMQRCQRLRRHRAPAPVRQSPPLAHPAPTPALVAAARASCASVAPTPAAWVAASTRAYRRCSMPCETSRQTCAAPNRCPRAARDPPPRARSQQGIAHQSLRRTAPAARGFRLDGNQLPAIQIQYIGHTWLDAALLAYCAAGTANGVGVVAPA